MSLSRKVTSLCGGVLLAYAALMPGIAEGQSSGTIAVGRNVHVSRGFADAMHDEVLIDADPANPSRLVACSIYEPSNGAWNQHTVVYVSEDGGKSWSRPMIVDSLAADATHPWPESSVDPACVFGLNGRIHFSRMRTGLVHYWSDDAGRTWNRSSIPPHRRIDRDYLSVDHTGGKYHGRVYAFAQAGGEALDQGYIPYGITLWRSLDGGKTFERPVQRFQPPWPEGGAMNPGNSVILSDGTWFASFAHTGPGIDRSRKHAPSSVTGSIKIMASRDGGESLDPAVTVAKTYGEWEHPHLAADAHGTTFKDRIYMAWVDQRYGDRQQVMVSYSTDKGKTWSAPRLVNDDVRYRRTGGPERGVGRFYVATNRHGVVGILWEDSRNNVDDARAFEMRFSASLDGGDTWLPSVTVSEQGYSVRQEKWIASTTSWEWSPKTTFNVDRQGSAGYHTIGLTADVNGVFHGIWTDNRTGVNQAWTAPIIVTGTPVKFGAPDLAGSTDLSNKVKIEILGSAYDGTTRRITVRARLRNQSADTISGPLKVRALLMASEATTSGAVHAVDSENRVKGQGAAWDFTTLIDGMFAPGAVTKERTLVFSLPDLDSPGEGKQFSHGSSVPRRLLRFEGQVIGSIRAPARALR